MTAHEAGTPVERVAALERQLDRERHARREAESIAEQRLRELWTANESNRLERSEELDHLRAAAEAATRAKQSFLAHVGNALETPMHAILGNLELINDEALGDDDRNRLHIVRGAASTLAATIDGLIELAASEGRPFTPAMELRSPLDFLDALGLRWQRRLAAKGQLLVTDLKGTDHGTRADWHRLHQVADQLLENVEQHAATGRVGVSLGHSKGLLTLVVSDQGPGFPSDLLDDVLLPFFRVDASPWSSKSGIGIGLAVVVRLLESAGGSVRLETGPAGTTVTAVLPVERRRRPRDVALA